MAEENKVPPALNLTGAPPQSQPDANATPKPDNTDQTVVGAPNAPGEDLTRTQSGAPTDTSAAADILAANHAIDAAGVVGAEEGEVIYTSHPVMGLKIGPFQFENGVLRLSDPKEKEQFQSILDALLPRDRNMVRTISLDKVDQILAERQQVLATRQFDSSVGREARDLLRGSIPTVGVEDISHAATPQSDQNIPVVPNAPVDPQGQTGLDQGPHTDPPVQP